MNAFVEPVSVLVFSLLLSAGCFGIACWEQCRLGRALLARTSRKKLLLSVGTQVLFVVNVVVVVHVAGQV